MIFDAELMVVPLWLLEFAVEMSKNESIG